MINSTQQIAIAGNIGAGKTTMTEKLAHKFNLEPIYESVDDNPYLNDFYDNMGRWSFNLQIFFLYKRFSNQIRLLKKNKGFIQDRSIYEDKEIFARNLKDLNFMSTRDWLTYQNLFNEMINFIKEPDLIIYLKASTVTLISRIKNRKRDFEKDISVEDKLRELIDISNSVGIAEKCRKVSENLFSAKKGARDYGSLYKSLLNQ